MPGVVRGILLGAPYLYGSSGSISSPSAEGGKTDDMINSNGFESPALNDFMVNLALNYSTAQLALEVIALVEFAEIPLLYRGVVFLSPTLVALTSVGENYLPEDWAKRSVELKANIMKANETICMVASVTSSVALIVFGQPVTGGVALTFVAVSLIRKNMKDCTYTELAFKLAPYAALAIGTAGVTTFFMPAAAGLLTQAVTGGTVTQLATGVGTTAVTALFDAVTKRMKSTDDPSSNSSVVSGSAVQTNRVDDKNRSLAAPSLVSLNEGDALKQAWEEANNRTMLEGVWDQASSPKVIGLEDLIALSTAWEEASVGDKIERAKALVESSEYLIEEDVFEQFREALEAAMREAEEKAAEALRLEEERKAQEVERKRMIEECRNPAAEEKLRRAIEVDRKKPIMERTFFGARL